MSTLSREVLKCGLVNRANPCRCARKTRGFIAAGYVDPHRLLFARERVRQVHEVVPKAYAALMSLDSRCAEIYREHPFAERRDLVPALRQLLENPDFRSAAGTS